MKEFDISDKELKSLLKSEGLESPSVDFNNSVLAKIEQKQSEKVKPAKAPKWILVLMAFLFIAPTVYFIFYGDPSLLDDRSVNIPLFSTAVSTKSVLILTLAIFTTGMALLFNYVLRRQPGDETAVKKG